MRNQKEMELALDRPRLAPSGPQAAVAPAPSRDRTDADLLTCIAGGDRTAFELLYRRFARSILGLALRRLGDRGRAEDAVQETFASIWRSAKSYRPERGPGAPWVYAVARNAISDRGRARHEPPVEVPDEPSTDLGPDEQAEHGWLSMRVHRALESLSDHERTLIELAYWGGLSQSEIAVKLGMPLGTVKTRTRAALARLAVVLEEIRMSREPDFDQLVGREGSPEELERLRHVHDLLISAGPPPELPARLATVSPPGRVLSLPRPRREALIGLAAAACVAIAFGIGLVVANGGSTFSAIRSVSMHALGTSTASAAIEVGKIDASGNWPLRVTVRNLPRLSNGWYELYLTRKGKRIASCGTFNAAGSGSARIRLSVPYKLSEYDGWVVTGRAEGQPERVLLTT